MFMLRGGYRAEISEEIGQESIYDGPSAGASISVPMNKERKSSRLTIDYAYRSTRVWDGTHNFGIRVSL